MNIARPKEGFDIRFNQQAQEQLDIISDLCGECSNFFSFILPTLRFEGHKVGRKTDNFRKGSRVIDTEFGHPNDHSDIRVWYLPLGSTITILKISVVGCNKID